MGLAYYVAARSCGTRLYSIKLAWLGLIIRAEDESGAEGVEEIPFHVQNGPGILVSGLRPGSTRGGTLHLTADAFSTDDPFDPRRAEARSSVPVWVWVLCLFVVAWAVFYAARMWEVPAQYQHAPTYGTQVAAPPAPRRAETGSGVDSAVVGHRVCVASVRRRLECGRTGAFEATSSVRVSSAPATSCRAQARPVRSMWHRAGWHLVWPSDGSVVVPVFRLRCKPSLRVPL